MLLLQLPEVERSRFPINSSIHAADTAADENKTSTDLGGSCL